MKKNSVINNYLYNLSYQIFAVIVPLITTPYVSRVLLSKGVGIYSYTYTIAFAFSLFAALGINQYGQREIAYYQSDIKKRSNIFWELCIIRGCAVLIVLTAYLVSAFCYKGYRGYLLLQGFVVLAVLLDISWFFQGIENFKTVAIRNIAVKIITVICVFIFVKDKSDVGNYILLNSASVFVGNALFLFSLKGNVCKIRFSELCIKRHIKPSFEFFIPLIATQIYSQLDKIMLGAINNSMNDNGYYEQARKITNLLMTTITSLDSVLFSRVSYLYANNEKEKIAKAHKISFHIIMLMIWPMVIGLFVIAGNFVNWFFGPEYDKVVVLLRISCPLIIFMSIGNFVGMQYLSPTGQQNKMTLVYIIAACVNFVLNCLLIRRWASIGALVASVLAESVSCFLQVMLMKRSDYNFQMMKGVWKYILSSLIMGIAIWYMDNYISVRGWLLTLIEIIIGAFIYIIMLILMRDDMVVKVLKKSENTSSCQ